MTETKIELIKLYNGDYVIGELETENENKIAYKNPRLLVMMPTMSGSVQMGIKPLTFPFKCKRLSDHIDIETSQILYRLYDSSNEIDGEIIKGYNSEVTGIKIASAKDTAAVANGDLII